MDAYGSILAFCCLSIGANFLFLAYAVYVILDRLDKILEKVEE